MRLLPHIIVRNSGPPRWAGRLFIGRSFVAWTWMCFTFLHISGQLLPAQKKAKMFRHEYRHVQQWAALTVLGWLCGALAGASWLWWLAVPIVVQPVAVGIAGIAGSLRGSGYRDNWFERDARRYARELI